MHTSSYLCWHLPSVAPEQILHVNKCTSIRKAPQHDSNGCYLCTVRFCHNKHARILCSRYMHELLQKYLYIAIVSVRVSWQILTCNWIPISDTGSALAGWEIALAIASPPTASTAPPYSTYSYKMPNWLNWIAIDCSGLLHQYGANRVEDNSQSQ